MIHTKRISLDTITDMTIDLMLEKGHWDEKKAIEVGDRFNELRERTGTTAKASKQSYQNYVLSSLVFAETKRK